MLEDQPGRSPQAALEDGRQARVLLHKSRNRMNLLKGTLPRV